MIFFFHFAGYYISIDYDDTKYKDDYIMHSPEYLGNLRTL